MPNGQTDRRSYGSGNDTAFRYGPASSDAGSIPEDYETLGDRGSTHS